jgi:hypothetical protein
MNRTKLTFQSQNLIVDYITFKFQDLDNLNQTRIAKYLFQLGFNSYQESAKLAKPIKEPILVNSKNQFEVSFVGDNSYWGGTLLHFSGTNATRFYFFSKEQIIDWTIFSSGVLSRFDLYYYRENKKQEKISSTNFLDNCYKKLKQTNKNVSLEKNRKGFILKIGNRKSNQYSRIYQTKQGLKFEHEMKGKFLQHYHLLLVENRLEEFEHHLTECFLYRFGKVLPLNYSYTDWLVVQLRPIRKQSIPKFFLNTEYFESNNLSLLDDRKNLDFKIDSLGEPPYRTRYRLLIFRIQDFLKFQNPMVKSTNYYQLKKVKEFFNQLQRNSLVTSFTDNQFRSLVTIPEVRVSKSKKQKNSLIARVWIAEELFYYNYPFLLPDFFRNKNTKDEFQVQFEILKVFSSVSIQKEVFIKEFLDSYPSVLSNQRRTKIKKLFIQLVGRLKENDLIESNYKIISNGLLVDVDQLTTSNIRQSFVLYEKLSI